MILKGLIDTDSINYKKICMVLEFPICKGFKCDKECGQQVCQNSALATAPNIEVNPMDLYKRYNSNPITRAVICQGLEPLDSKEDLWLFISGFRLYCSKEDDIIVYTGYNESEIKDKRIWNMFQKYNVIVKFGRYIPNQTPHYDEVLGVYLASDNQYAKSFNK